MITLDCKLFEGMGPFNTDIKNIQHRLLMKALEWVNEHILGLSFFVLNYPFLSEPFSDPREISDLVFSTSCMQYVLRTTYYVINRNGGLRLWRYFLYHVPCVASQ